MKSRKINESILFFFKIVSDVHRFLTGDQIKRAKSFYLTKSLNVSNSEFFQNCSRYTH